MDKEFIITRLEQKITSLEAIIRNDERLAAITFCFGVLVGLGLMWFMK